eukprot:3423277-Pyramimonas_sp.AAC.1
MTHWTQNVLPTRHSMTMSLSAERTLSLTAASKYRLSNRMRTPRSSATGSLPCARSALHSSTASS